jgi:hemerythrin-like metal-binding protein
VSLRTPHTLPLSGIEEIDAQHKKLVECFDQLELWVGKGHEFAATLDALGKLKRYVDEHFRFEEDMLREHGYPKLDEQITEHVEISGQLARLYRHVMSGGEATDDLLRLLREWLLSHIGVEDMEYAAYLATQSQLKSRSA